MAIHNVPNTKIGKMYREHIEMILKKDIDGLLDQYSEDCLHISTMTDDKKTPLYTRGRKALRKFFEERIFSIEDLDTSIAQWAESDNPPLLMMVENIKLTVGGQPASMSFYDNWVLDKDGRIKIHFAGVVAYPDGVYADGSKKG